MSNGAASEASTLGAAAKSDDGGGCEKRDRASRDNPVPKEGLEPSHPKAQEPKSCVSANSTTPAVKSGQSYEDSGRRRTVPNSGRPRHLWILRDAFSRLGGVRGGDGGITDAGDRAADQRCHDEHPHLGQRSTASEPGDTER